MKEGHRREGFAERCDPWELKGKVEVAFSTRDVRGRFSGKRVRLIQATTISEAVKSIPLVHMVRLHVNESLRHIPRLHCTSIIFSSLPL
jgi:hypothetical protein